MSVLNEFTERLQKCSVWWLLGRCCVCHRKMPRYCLCKRLVTLSGEIVVPVPDVVEDVTPELLAEADAVVDPTISPAIG